MNTKVCKIPLAFKDVLVRLDKNDTGYGGASTQTWKLYSTESERHDKTLVENWKSSADSMLIFVRSTNWVFLLVLPFHARPVCSRP